MKIKTILPAILAGSLFLGLGAFYPDASPAQVSQSVNQSQIDWTQGQMTVTGTGAAPSSGSMSPGQKRLMAQRAATADGYRQLAELINGVNVDAETIVRDFVTESDIVRTRVSGLIKGAKIGKPRYMSDGTVEIDVSLGVYGNNSLSSAILPPVIEKKQFKTQPSFTPATPTPTREPDISYPSSPEPTSTTSQQTYSGSHTGVIIDARGVGVAPAMSPQIVDTNGKEIYIGDRPIDPDLVVNMGIVGYAHSLEQAKANTRIGNQPLILKAVKAGGRHKTDAVVSPEHGQQIMQANGKNGFLEGSRVIFIIDKK